MLDTLRSRGLVKTVTSERLDTALRDGNVAFYCGVDPTAPSLHLGNLLTLIPSLHLVLAGHSAYALVGGATGRIGDPAGKATERDALARKTIDHNVDRLRAQLDRFFKNGVAYAQTRGFGDGSAKDGTWLVVNNADWYGELKFMDFMQAVGRNVRISSMLARDSVKNRLAGEGMSFGEFVYQLLQAYDFWHLFSTHRVRLQIGGSDQYGNITAGVDLIGRLAASTEPKAADAEREAFGMTVPLLTTPSGEKFGKSAGNAIWLDADMTSPFDLYQHFVNSPDEQIEQYFRLFTLLPDSEIVRLEKLRRDQPKSRAVQHTLAQEVLSLIHGVDEARRVATACRLFFPKDFQTEGAARTQVNAAEVLAAFRCDPCWCELPRSQVLDAPLTSLLREAGAVASGKAARQLISNGGMYVGTTKITDPLAKVQADWLLDDRVLVLRLGKNRFSIIELTT